MKKLLALALLGGAGYLLYKKFKAPEAPAEEKKALPPVNDMWALIEKKAAEASAKAAATEAEKAQVSQGQSQASQPMTRKMPLTISQPVSRKMMNLELSEVQEEGLSERGAAMTMTVRDLKPGGQVTLYHNLTNEQYTPIVPSVRAIEATHIKPIMVTERYVQFRNWGDRVESATFSVVGRVEYEPRSNLESLGETVVL